MLSDAREQEQQRVQLRLLAALILSLLTAISVSVAAAVAAVVAAGWQRYMHIVYGNTSGLDHAARSVAAARLPAPNYQEDNFVTKRISSAYNRAVQLDTADLSVITIVNSRDVTFPLRGYLVQSDRSRVRYDAATRERTAFVFSDRVTSGTLTWDRFLYLESLLARLGISCPGLQLHRPMLEMRDRLHEGGAPDLVVEADGGMVWLTSLEDPTLQLLEPELQRLGFSRRERGSGRAYAANLGRLVLDSLARLGRLYLIEMVGLSDW
jgi:hypothetical protein